MTFQPHAVAALGEQHVSNIIVSFVHQHQGSKEMTFPNEKSIQPFWKDVSPHVVALSSVGIWRDHVGNSHTRNDPLPRSPEP